MYQTIHEQIEVAGVYAQHTFIPKKFRWQGKEYWIDQITIVTDIRNGGLRKRQYSVTVGMNVYRLIFDRDQENWYLEEIWCE